MEAPLNLLLKRLVSVNICSVEGNSTGIFVNKMLPGAIIGDGDRN